MRNKPDIIFDADKIFFAGGYYFRHSSIYGSRIIMAPIINEVNMHTAPPSMVINSNEVIFVHALHARELEAFARRNNIPITERFDIWSAINEPFLDTEYPPEDQENTLKLLAENGVSRDETAGIRQKIKRSMLRYNGLHWDWVNLGHMDYLQAGFRSRKSYSWSMDIALRNFNP